jgi:iron complex transport system substrate-binding protein
MKKGLKKLLLKGTILSVCVAMLMSAMSGCKSSATAPVSSQSGTQVITDMANRKNTVPTDITKISVVHPIPCQMVWRLAPDKLVSVDKQFDDRLEFMSSDEQTRLKALPITGEFHSGLSAEQILAANPQLVISLTKDTDIETEQRSFNVPVVAASKDTLHDLADSWRFVGKVVGNEKEGNELGDYWDSTMKMVTDQTDKIADKDKLKVYYAQSPISNTVGPKTIMASIISLAGGVSYMEANPPKASDATNESIAISMEEILKWNPDVIITKDAKGRDEILSSAAWKDVTAVKNKRVYASTKYEMLDRTQSLMGLLWTAKTLYPDKVTFDLNKEVRTFYSKVYLDNNVTDDQISKTN